MVSSNKKYKRTPFETLEQFIYDGDDWNKKLLDERIVAQAAPATPIWNTRIKNRSRKIFRIEENTRK